MSEERREGGNELVRKGGREGGRKEGCREGGRGGGKVRGGEESELTSKSRNKI